MANSHSWILRLLFTCLILYSFNIHAAAIKNLPDIHINGFATVAGVATNNNEASYFEADKEALFDTDSIAGIQMMMPVNDRTRFTVQLIAKGINGYNVETEWAYGEIQLDSYSKLRAGRLRIPFYQISNSLEVGYSYPWIRPPLDVYGLLDFTRFDGVDMLFTLPLGEADLVLQPYFGSTNSDQEFNGEKGNLRVRNLLGLNAVVTYEWMKLRIGHVEGDFTLEGIGTLDAVIAGLEQIGYGSVADEFSGDDMHGAFSGIGLDINLGDFKLLTEYTMRKAGGVAFDFNAWYITGAYRFGRWTPHLTFSEMETDEEYDDVESNVVAISAISPVLAGGVRQLVHTNTRNQQSITAGLRVDVMERTALKLEWQRISPEKGSTLLELETTNEYYGGDDNYYATDNYKESSGDDVDIYSIGLDFIF